MMNQAKQKLANAMTFSEYKYHILADAYRITAKLSMIVLVKLLFFGGSFKYIFWMRTCSFLKTNRYLKYVLYPIALLALRRLTYKFGISIPAETKIGPGLYIGHFGGIVVNSRTVIGKNFTVSQGVTLGKANRGKKQGYPNVGDNVYIGPGAKVVGNVKIGNNVAVGANCVITTDVSDNSVVVGIPGKVISENGAGAYVTKTDYEEKIGCRRVMRR